jgi:hypothetical protein
MADPQPLRLHTCVCGNVRIIANMDLFGGRFDSCGCAWVPDASLADFLDCHPAIRFANLRQAIIRSASGPFRTELFELIRAWDVRASNPDDSDYAELKAIVLSNDPMAWARDTYPQDNWDRVVPNSVKYVLRQLEAWLQEFRTLRVALCNTAKSMRT